MGERVAASCRAATFERPHEVGGTTQTTEHLCAETKSF